MEEGGSVEAEGRFFEDDARLAAWRIDLACFGSEKISWILGNEVAAKPDALRSGLGQSRLLGSIDVQEAPGIRHFRVAYLISSAFCSSLTLPMAVGKGTFASWDRNRSSAWTSSFVVIAEALWGDTSAEMD